MTSARPSPEYPVNARLGVLVIVLIVGGLGLEAVTAWRLAYGTFGGDVAALVLGHGAASLMLAIAMSEMLRRRYEAACRNVIVLLFAVNFFIPCFGVLGVLCGLFPALLWRREGSRTPVLSWSARDLSSLPVSASQGWQANARCCNEGRLKGILKRSGDADKRLQAVLDTLRLHDKAAIPLLQLALRDAEDEVRLLAYSLLERKEQAISGRIRARVQALEAVSGEKRADVHKAIAQDCWELAYLGLAQGEVLNHLLETALTHVDEAIRLDPHRPGLHMLQGKLLLRKKAWQQAAGAFEQAGRLGIDQRKIETYLDEAAFAQRRMAAGRESPKSMGGTDVPDGRQDAAAVL